MDIQTMFEPLVKFESDLAGLYEWYSELFRHDNEAAFVFIHLAAEEQAHVTIVKYLRRLVRNSPKEFADVTLDLEPVEEALVTIASFRSAPQSTSLEEALRAALTLEKIESEYHLRASVEQANAHVARVLDALGTADRIHLGKLVAFAKKRGIGQPTQA